MPRKQSLWTCTLALILCPAVFGGCVATQNVPVSTDPSGAVVYLDGERACAATPCSVTIAKDQDHLLTLIKPGYRQKDIPVRRVYDAAGLLRKSASAGVRAALGGASPTEALSSAADTFDAQDKQGRDYVLSPDMVVLRLIPVGQPDPAEARADEQARRSEANDPDPVALGLGLYRILQDQRDRQDASPDQ